MWGSWSYSKYGGSRNLKAFFWSFYTLHLGISFTQLMLASLLILTPPKVYIHKPVMELCPQAGRGMELD